MRFYLGAQEVCWLGRADVPMFLSARRLQRIKRRFPHALAPWVLDSGGFTMIAREGAYPDGWLDELARLGRIGRDAIGRLEWVAHPDWMCEPEILQRTGLTVDEHLRRTVASYIEAKTRHPDLPWAPVLQGWQLADYLRCVELYREAGVDLTAEPIVGVGTICSRQGTAEATAILAALGALGLKLHAFGLKTEGHRAIGDTIASADSMAWSLHARRNKIRLPGCTHKGHCGNCMRYALSWRRRILGPKQPSLFGLTP